MECFHVIFLHTLEKRIHPANRRSPYLATPLRYVFKTLMYNKKNEIGKTMKKLMR